MKREALDHTKMKRLCRRLNIPLYQGVGLLETLWHITAKQAPRGDIGKLSNEDIAIGLDYRENEDVLIDAFLASGWLETNPEYRLVVHDWHEHSDDAVNLRLARAHLRYWSGQMPKMTRMSLKEREECHQSYQSVRTDSDFVRTESARHAHGVCTESALPEPEPLPEPVPEPEPEPVGVGTLYVGSSRANGNGKMHPQPPAGISLQQTAERMLKIHPTRSSPPMVERALLDAVARGNQPKAIESSHAAWCAADDWRGDQKKFCPSLQRWIAEDGYTKRPAKPAASKELYL